jgi:phosphoserine aminotransferase
MRIFNFSAGRQYCRPVLEQVRDELLDWHGRGMGIMEMSHRGKDFTGVIDEAEADLRELMGIPPTTRCCSCRGDPAVRADPDEPAGRSADYVVTGSWSKKAIKEAQRRRCVWRAPPRLTGSPACRRRRAEASTLRPPTCTSAPTRPSTASRCSTCPNRRPACRWWPT